MEIPFVSFYKVADFVTHQIRKSPYRTQTATTDTRPPLVASQYGNGLPDRLTDTGFEFHVREICCVTLTAKTIWRSQQLFSRYLDYSKMENYHLQPKKRVILEYQISVEDPKGGGRGRRGYKY